MYFIINNYANIWSAWIKENRQIFIKKLVVNDIISAILNWDHVMWMELNIFENSIFIIKIRFI